MKKFYKHGFQGLLIVSLLLACMFAFTACGDNERRVAAPQVHDVTLSVEEGHTFGLAGETHTLAYTATEGSSVSVTVSKNGTAATADDYSYSADSKNIVFKTSGQYIVFVTATKDGLSYAGTVGLTVYTQNDLAPIVRIGFTRITVNTPMPLYTAQYQWGATKESENISVEYRANDGEYAAAASNTDYVFEDGKFTAKHDSGTYRVTVQVTDTRGATASATAEIATRTTPEPLTITPATNLVADGWNRVSSYDTVTLEYTVEGDSSEYDCVVTENDDLQIRADENGMVVQTSGAGTYTVGVTYRHRGDPTQTYSISYDLQVVDSLTYAPVFGADPFGDTYDSLIPSTGLMLYHDVYTPDGITALTYENISYTVKESHVTTAGGDGLTPVCMNAGGNVNFPFVYVPNFENNTATGSFTVKMEATYQNYTAVAYKTFTMTACGKNDGNDNTALQDYFKAVAPDSDFSLTSQENMTFDARQNSSITNDGIIAQRDSTWALSHLGGVNLKGKVNCQIDFTLTRLKGDIKLNIGLRTGNKDGWADYIRIQASSDAPGKMTAVYDRTADLSNVTKIADTSRLPDMNEFGKATHVRITRTQTGGTNALKIEFSDNGTDYYEVYSATLGGSDAGKPGASLFMLQFDHEAGCFAIEGVRVTDL